MRIRLRGFRFAVAVLCALAAPAVHAAGPLLELAAPEVAPGEPVDLTVLGDPGHAYAVATSPTNRGLVVQGWPLQLGPDAVVVATGHLDPHGRALVTLQPELGPDGKLYLQAVTAPTTAFDGLVPTPGKLLRALATSRQALSVAVPGGAAERPDPAGPSPAGPNGVGQRLVTLATPGPGRAETLGCEACVDTANLRDGSVSAAKLAPGAVGSAAWGLTGNGGTDPASQFLGTIDGQPLEVRVNGARVLRLEPAGPPDASLGAGPTVLGGFGLNSVTAGVVGATIAGGGSTGGDCGGVGTPCPNRITDHFGTIGGGIGNQAGDGSGTLADRPFATVGGGQSNTASGFGATVGGGGSNRASGFRATVGGGSSNRASGRGSTAPGGEGAVAALHGQLAYAAGHFATDGDAQWSVYTLRAATTDTTSVPLDLNGSAPFTPLTVPGGHTLAFDGLVVARRTADHKSAGYRIQGVVRTDGATTAFIGTPSALLLGDEASAGWDVSLLADSTAHALSIVVTGETGQTIRWVAVVRTVEVGS